LSSPLARNASTRYRAELSGLQGNILKGHGREAAIHVFLTFRPGKRKAAREFLRARADTLTSAAEQQAQTVRFRRCHKSELFSIVCLSADGYRYLGVPVGKFKSVEFKIGMKHATERLYDPPPTEWEPKFQKALHAMVLLAHDSVPKLFQELGFLRTQVGAFADVNTELGIQLYNEHGLGIEHFGFRDGISQPLFFRADLKEKSRNTRCNDDAQRWSSAAGPNLVVIRDPLAPSDADCGTYY